MQKNFRAWDGVRWIYEDIFLSHDGILWYRTRGQLVRVGWKVYFSVDIKDKNGKTIYEGDILEETITNPQNGDELPYRKFEVYWNSNYASFSLKDLLNEDNDQETMWDISGLKIVGNIYENPELLDESK